MTSDGQNIATEDVLTWNEAASFLRISRRTLERLECQRRIPSIVISENQRRSIKRFLRSDLVAWMHRHRRAR